MTDIQERVSAMKPADKVIGAFLLLVVGGAGLFGLATVLPFLIALATNTIFFVSEIIVLLILAMIFLDPSTWRNMYYGWQNISRSIRRFIIVSDPIGVLSTVIQRYDAKLTEIDRYIVEADAACKRQLSAIKDAFKGRDQEISLAKEAERRGNQLQTGQHALAAKRWEDSANDMQPMYEKIEGALKMTEQARDLCAVKLEDFKNQKIVLARKLDALQSSQKAIHKIKSFFGGNPDLDMQEMAVEEIEKDASRALAEIDQFTRVMKPAIETQDLKRGADMTAAMEHFSVFLTGAAAAKQLTEGPIQNQIPVTVIAKEKVQR